MSFVTEYDNGAGSSVLARSYGVLTLLVGFSAYVCHLAMTGVIPKVNTIVQLVALVLISLLVISASFVRNKIYQFIVSALYSGIIGYVLSDQVAHYVNTGRGDLIELALAGTAVILFVMSIIGIFTKRSLNGLYSFVAVGFVVMLVASIAAIWIHLTAFQAFVSAGFMILSSVSIVLTVNEATKGGEDSAILVALSVFCSLINIFISLLRIFDLFSED